MLPAGCQQVASMLQDVARILPACNQYVASMLPVYCCNVNSILLQCCQHFASMLPQCFMQVQRVKNMQKHAEFAEHCRSINIVWQRRLKSFQSCFYCSLYIQIIFVFENISFQKVNPSQELPSFLLILCLFKQRPASNRSRF